jgi:hypothetical protein
MDQPKNSRAELERTRDGLRLMLPPVGVSRAGHGLFWVGLCFCAGVAIISVAWVLIAGAGSTHKGVYTPPDPNRAPIPWQMWVGMSGFGLASLAVTMYGLSLGRRSAVIEVAGDSLLVREKGLFRSRTYQWSGDELKAIQSGPSGMSVGGGGKAGSTRSGKGLSILQFHVYLKDGRRIRLLTGRDGKELDWIAAQLRAGLSATTTKYDGG